MKSFSLLLLGMFLSSLATLNFSLSFLVGLLASPLSFVDAPSPPPVAAAAAGKTTGRGARALRRWLLTALLNLVAPTTVLLAGSRYWGVPASEILRMAAFGWDVWGTYTAVVVWCVWWPAWLVGSVLVLARPTPASVKGKTA